MNFRFDARARMAAVSLSVLGLTACGADANSTQASSPTAASAVTFADQSAAGGKLYGAKCAGCHGSGGEGTSTGPRVVDLKKGALPLDPRAGSKRGAKFTTVADVADFVVKNMPPGGAGTLSADEYWAILAFDLDANGIKLDKKLTPDLAATLTIPR